MNIHSINGVSSSNNNCSFKKLSHIQYLQSFNPKKNTNDARAVLRFLKSETFKKFFEKYDGYAKFGRYSFTRGNQATKGQAYLDIFYREKEKPVEQATFTQKLLAKLSNIFKRKEYSVIQYSVIGDLEDLSRNLGTKIGMLTEEEINYKINEMQRQLSKESNPARAEALKNMNAQIDEAVSKLGVKVE